MVYAYIFKANPYHDEVGWFSTSDKAVFVSLGPKFGNATRGQANPNQGRTLAKGRVNKRILGTREAQLAHLVKLHGLEDELQAAKTNVERLLKDSVVVVQRRSAAALEDLILGSGRIRTQFETGRSAGTYDPGYRSKVESMLFAMHDNASHEPENRPVYGTLQSPNASPEDIRYSSSYGPIRITLKPSANERVTFTANDSLNTDYRNGEPQFQPSAVTDPKMSTLFSQDQLDPSVSPEYVSRTLQKAAKATSVQGLVNGWYVESQIHGQLRKSDIASITLPAGPIGYLGISTEVLKAAQAAGIEVKYGYHS